MSSLNYSSNTSTTGDIFGDPTHHIIIKIRRSKEEFIGEYVGRQLVKSDALPKQTYKDIILIDKDESVIETLNDVYDAVMPFYDEEKWLGLTRTIVDDEVQNYKLWVDLADPIPLGKHRFRLRSFKVSDTVLQFLLKVLKPVEDDNSTTWVDNKYENFDVKEIATFHNLCEVGKFSAVVILSIITLTGNFLWYCADFTIKMTHELSRMITVITPIIFELINFMSKCVGGLYWLLYMIWRGILDPRPLATPPLAANAPLAIMSNGRRYTNYSYDNLDTSNNLRRSYPRNNSNIPPPLAIMPNPRRPVTLDTSTASPRRSILKNRDHLGNLYDPPVLREKMIARTGKPPIVYK